MTENNVRIKMVKDGQPLLSCPHCNADWTKPGALKVTVNTSDDKWSDDLDTLDVTVGPDGFLPDTDDDGFEWDHGTECETKCAHCGNVVNEFFQTKHD